MPSKSQSLLTSISVLLFKTVCDLLLENALQKIHFCKVNSAVSFNNLFYLTYEDQYNDQSVCCFYTSTSILILLLLHSYNHITSIECFAAHVFLSIWCQVQFCTLSYICCA